MRPQVITVGPLATATATKVATAQRNYGVNGALALLGAASDFVAGTVAASQSPGAAALTINGSRVNAGVAYLGGGQYVYITSGGDDHAITFAVVGTAGLNNIVVKETLQGTNAQFVASKTAFNSIISITPSGAVASSVAVGSYTQATLDVARRLLFTTTADETANVATIVGTDWAGNPITENLTLVNNTTVASALSYKTVTRITLSAAAAGNISVGTNAVAASPWARLDGWAPGPVTGQFVVTGTANYDVQTSNDDPNYPVSVPIGSMTWDSQLAGIQGATASAQISIQAAPLWMRIILNSGTGSVTGTIVQAGVNPI